MTEQTVAVTIGKAVVVYIITLIAVRLLGKRAVGNFSAFDLLVALMIGDMVGDTIFASVPLKVGIAGILTIAGLEYGNSWLSYFGLDRFFEGMPTIVVNDGECRREGLRKERMNRRDIMAALREHGITDIRQIKLAVVETDGHVSVIEHEWSMPAEKADLSSELARERIASLKVGAGDDASTIASSVLPRN